MTNEQGSMPDSPQVSPDGKFWWDGQAWQPMRSAESPSTPAETKGKGEKNTVGTAALVTAIIGFIFACIPGALIVGWILLPVAFILSIVGLVGSGKKKGAAVAGLIISIVGTIVGFLVFFVVVGEAFEESFEDVAPSPTSIVPTQTVLL